MSISKENTEAITADLKDIFPDVTAKVKANGDGSAEIITAVVPSIDTTQLVDLHLLISDTSSNVKLKRSGTSISIQFT